MGTCANCGAELHGRYCSACGEKKLSATDLSVGHFAEHALHDLTHFDTKVFKSVRFLFTRPGFLTAEFSAGRWKSLIKPTTLFILLNVFFFFAKGGIFNWGAETYVNAAGSRATAMVVSKAAERHLEVSEYMRRFDEAAREKQHGMFFFAIPVVALVSFVFFRKRYLVEHIVYSIHFHAFMLLFLTVGVQVLFRVVLKPLVWLGQQDVVLWLAREPALDVWVALGLGAYHVAALRRAFTAGWGQALLVATVLVVAEGAFLTQVYQPLMFYWVYYTA